MRKIKGNIYLERFIKKSESLREREREGGGGGDREGVS